MYSSSLKNGHCPLIKKYDVVGYSNDIIINLDEIMYAYCLQRPIYSCIYSAPHYFWIASSPKVFRILLFHVINFCTFSMHNNLVIFFLSLKTFLFISTILILDSFGRTRLSSILIIIPISLESILGCLQVLSIFPRL